MPPYVVEGGCGAVEAEGLEEAEGVGDAVGPADAGGAVGVSDEDGDADALAPRRLRGRCGRQAGTGRVLLGRRRRGLPRLPVRLVGALAGAQDAGQEQRPGDRGRGQDDRPGRDQPPPLGAAPRPGAQVARTGRSGVRRAAGGGRCAERAGGKAAGGARRRNTGGGRTVHAWRGGHAARRAAGCGGRCGARCWGRYRGGSGRWDRARPVPRALVGEAQGHRVLRSRPRLRLRLRLRLADGGVLGELPGHRRREPALGASQATLRVGCGAQTDDVGRGEPLRGDLAQAAGHQLGYLGGEFTELRLLVHDPVQHPVRGAVAEGAHAGRGERRDLAEREHIGRPGDLPAQRLLGRHESGCPDGGPAVGEGGGIRGSCHAEVDDAGSVQGEQHVRRLEVAVHDPGPMDVLEGLGHPRGQQEHRRHGQRPVLLDGVGEGGPGNVGRGEPGRTAVGVAVENGRRVHALYATGVGDLLAEPLAEVGVVGQLGTDDLHGDGPSAGRVREVDPPHPAGSEPRHETVRPDRARIVVPERLERLRTRSRTRLHVPDSPWCSAACRGDRPKP